MSCRVSGAFAWREAHSREMPSSLVVAVMLRPTEAANVNPPCAGDGGFAFLIPSAGNSSAPLFDSRLLMNVLPR
jgi:hypothetical protein